MYEEVLREYAGYVGLVHHHSALLVLLLLLINGDLESICLAGVRKRFSPRVFMLGILGISSEETVL